MRAGNIADSVGFQGRRWRGGGERHTMVGIESRKDGEGREEARFLVIGMLREGSKCLGRRKKSCLSHTYSWNTWSSYIPLSHGELLHLIITRTHALSFHKMHEATPSLGAFRIPNRDVFPHAPHIPQNLVFERKTGSKFIKVEDSVV